MFNPFLFVAKRRLKRKADDLILFGQEYKVLLHKKDRLNKEKSTYIDQNPEHKNYQDAGENLKKILALGFFIFTALFDTLFCSHSLKSLTQEVGFESGLLIFCTALLIVYQELVLGIFKMREQHQMAVINQAPLLSTIEGRKYFFLLFGACLFTLGLPAISMIELSKEIGQARSEVTAGLMTDIEATSHIATLKFRYFVLGIMSIIMHGTFLVVPDKVIVGITYFRCRRTIKAFVKVANALEEEQLIADGRLNIFLSAYLLEEHAFINRYGKSLLPPYVFPSPIDQILDTLRKKIYS